MTTDNTDVNTTHTIQSLTDIKTYEDLLSLSEYTGNHNTASHIFVARSINPLSSANQSPVLGGIFEYYTGRPEVWNKPHIIKRIPNKLYRVYNVGSSHKGLSICFNTNAVIFKNRIRSVGMVTINTPKLLIDVYYIENALFTITPSNYTSENYGHTIAIDDRIEDLTPVNISSNPDLYSQMVLDSSRM